MASKVTEAPPAPANGPPRPLAEDGKRFWESKWMREFQFSDAAGIEQTAVDRRGD